MGACDLYCVLCEPYSDKPQTRGKPAIDPDYLKELVVNADKENFAVSLTHVVMVLCEWVLMQLKLLEKQMAKRYET